MARVAEEIAESLREAATSRCYKSVSAFFYEVVDILANDLTVSSNFSEAEGHPSVCQGFMRWLDETVLVLDSLEPAWGQDFGFRGMITLLNLYIQLRRSAFGDMFVIRGDKISVPEYLFPALRAVYRWAVDEPGEIAPEHVDARFLTPLELLPQAEAAEPPIRYWPESRKPNALDSRMRVMRYTRLVITELTFPGSRVEGRPQVRLMEGSDEESPLEEEDDEQGGDQWCDEDQGCQPQEDEGAYEEQREFVLEQELVKRRRVIRFRDPLVTPDTVADQVCFLEEEEDVKEGVVEGEEGEEGEEEEADKKKRPPTPPIQIEPELLGFFLSSSPVAEAILSGNAARTRQFRTMQRRLGPSAVILVQGPVPSGSPFFERRDPQSGWIADKAERKRLNFRDGQTSKAHRRYGTASKAEKHITNKNIAAFFQTHGLITERDYAKVFFDYKES
jgi:hypothetical protein